MASYPPLRREIVLLTGQVFNPWSPDRNKIDTVQIARTLSRTPRWAGQTVDFYSVAQHCCLVHDLVPEWIRLPALLHDAHEALTGFGDVPSPNKQQVTAIGDLEHRVDSVIALAYGFDRSLFDNLLISTADKTVLATEIQDLLPQHIDEDFEFVELPKPLDDEIKPWTMEEAEAQFMRRALLELTRTKSGETTIKEA